MTAPTLGLTPNAKRAMPQEDREAIEARIPDGARLAIGARSKHGPFWAALYGTRLDFYRDRTTGPTPRIAAEHLLERLERAA